MVLSSAVLGGPKQQTSIMRFDIEVPVRGVGNTTLGTIIGIIIDDSLDLSPKPNVMRIGFVFYRDKISNQVDPIRVFVNYGNQVAVVGI